MKVSQGWLLFAVLFSSGALVLPAAVSVSPAGGTAEFLHSSPSIDAESAGKGASGANARYDTRTQGIGSGRGDLYASAARRPTPSGDTQPVAENDRPDEHAASDGGHRGASSGASSGAAVGGRFGGVSGFAGGRSSIGRRPRQSETATFFNSLDDNADGVLAEDEIREFVEEVGGSTLDDHSEIVGGVSTVMGRLDTDSEKGIGLQELSSWINRLGSILTVEEAADWVTHAVQLPTEVADAFRSNSVSGYDFLELVEDNGAGLYYDLGIKRSYRKRIVKAIEIRLMGLGDEPPPPVLHTPLYLGGGRARIEWSDKEAAPSVGTPASMHTSDGDDDGGFTAASPSSSEEDKDEYEERVRDFGGAIDAGSGAPRGLNERETAKSEAEGAGAAGMVDAGTTTVTPAQSVTNSIHGGRGAAATFPVHKYVLQRSCLGHHVAASVSTGDGSSRAAGSLPSSDSFGESAVHQGWVTIHEADVGLASSAVFVDSGLSPGKTYVYRLRAWNLIGHSGASIAHVTTSPSKSLWTKPWRLISPWWPVGNTSTAPGDGVSSPSPGVETPTEVMELMNGSSTEAEEGWGWKEWMNTGWWVLSWTWRAVVCALRVVQGLLILAGISTNLVRLRAAYGEGGTGSSVRRNWPAALLWKLSRFLTSNQLICGTIDFINTRLEQFLGTPTPVRGIQRQESTRDLWNGLNASAARRNSSGGRAEGGGDVSGLYSIEEEFVGMGVDGGWGFESRGLRWPTSDSLAGRKTGSRVNVANTSGSGRGPRAPSRSTTSSEGTTRSSSPALDAVGGIDRFRGAYSEAPTFRYSASSNSSGSSSSSRASAVVEGTTRGSKRSLDGHLWSASPLSSSSSSFPAPPPPPPGANPAVGSLSERSTEGSAERRWSYSRRQAFFSWRKLRSASSAEFVGEKGHEELSGGNDDGPTSEGRHEELSLSGQGCSGRISSEGVPGVARGTSDVAVGGGAAAENGGVGEVVTTPKLQPGGSTDLPRTLHLRKSSVSRMALGLKKGEASGRDRWRQELHVAEACFSCRKRFKAITRQRHHCGRCHRVFCSKHGFASHSRVMVCSVPGDCICDVCLASVSGSTHILASEASREGEAMLSEGNADATHARLVESDRSFKRKRRFIWRRSTSFGHLRGQVEPAGETQEGRLRSDRAALSASTHKTDVLAAESRSVGTQPSSATFSPETAERQRTLAATASPSHCSHTDRAGGALVVDEQVSIDSERVNPGGGSRWEMFGVRRRITR